MICDPIQCCKVIYIWNVVGGEVQLQHEGDRPDIYIYIYIYIHSVDF